MKPFIVTELQAGKLPRWALWLVCALYILPGFAGRDPWRPYDASGFGIALTMMRGDAGDWLLPSIAGLPVVQEGPLAFWIMAVVGRAAQGLLGEHGAVALAVILILGLALALVWFASHALARRQGVQPSDPFGASASRDDYGRAIADTAVLVLMATFGLLVRMHETTAEPAQLAWIALFLCGCAQALQRPAGGGAMAGAAIGASLLTGGVGHAAALLVTIVLLPMVSHGFRLVGRRMLLFAALAAVLVAASWPWLLRDTAGGHEHLRQWLDWNLDTVSGPTSASAIWFLRNAPWFFWPAWPVAAWAAWRWRGRWGEPALALSALTTLTLLARALLAPQGAEVWLLPVTVPLALLAALGMPTLRRALVNLIDWFAVTTFTLMGVAIWAWWIALMTGVPPRMAFRMRQMAPGFLPEDVSGAILLGLAATIAWLLLVRWRISRQPPMIWRAMVLSCGGVVLMWFLLMTLWLPVFNERNTYRDIATELQVAWQTGSPRPGDCVATRGVERAARASFYYFTRLPFAAPGTACRWQLVQYDGHPPPAADDAAVTRELRWIGQRRINREERFALYRDAAR